MAKQTVAQTRSQRAVNSGQRNDAEDVTAYQPPLTVSLSLAVGGCRRQHRGVSGEGRGGPRKRAQDFQISSHVSGRNRSAGRRSTKLRAKRGPSALGLSAIY